MTQFHSYSHISSTSNLTKLDRILQSKASQTISPTLQTSHTIFPYVFILTNSIMFLKKDIDLNRVILGNGGDCIKRS